MLNSGRDEKLLDVPMKYVIFGNLEIGLKSAKISPNQNLGYHKISLIAPKYRFVDDSPEIKILKKHVLSAKTPATRSLQIRFEYHMDLRTVKYADL
jgi:hypothetical protein